MNKIPFLILLLILLMHKKGLAQTRSSEFLENILSEKGSPELKKILEQPDTFRYQLIYTRIDRDKNNQPKFKNFFYRVNRHEYFNPASTVKMPVAFLALEKIGQLKKSGVNKFTPMLTDSVRKGQTAVTTDSSSESGLPSVAHYIKKIFLVSDNDAYTRLYEFLGQQYINERLRELGYKGTRITRRFIPLDEEEHKYTNPVRFYQDGNMLYDQPVIYNPVPFNFGKKILIGNAHYNRDEVLINEPMDFTRHNHVPLEDLRKMLQSVLFPESIPGKKRFSLTEVDYKFLYQYMSKLPSESRYPTYDTNEFFDSYTKFFMFKSGRTIIPEHIRVFNKTGWSYGFLTDVAYIADFKNNVEFMLSGVIYVNSDGVLNDDKYEYDELGYPFFKEVGNIIYQYELDRIRKYAPDLSGFKIKYD